MALVFPNRRPLRSGSRPQASASRQAQLAGPRALTFGLLLGLASWTVVLAASFVTIYLNR